MKRSKAYVAARRDAIIALLESNGQMSVNALAERFEVSPLTIRRDLNQLETQQILTHEHGSAILLNPLGRPTGSQQVRANKSIAREAARHISNGECVFVSASSTAPGIISFITAEDVTVITNNGRVLQMDETPNVAILLTGSEVRPPRASMTGDIALGLVRRVAASKCFLGASGISAKYGLASATSSEPAVNALDRALEGVHRGGRLVQAGTRI